VNSTPVPVNLDGLPCFSLSTIPLCSSSSPRRPLHQISCPLRVVCRASFSPAVPLVSPRDPLVHSRVLVPGRPSSGKVVIESGVSSPRPSPQYSSPSPDSESLIAGLILVPSRFRRRHDILPSAHCSPLAAAASWPASGHLVQSGTYGRLSVLVLCFPCESTFTRIEQGEGRRKAN
jgi:hypothetical protein